ncbi:hypothetical protein LCGC14_2362210, partial [marine sediment metagenome]
MFSGILVGRNNLLRITLKHED